MPDQQTDPSMEALLSVDAFEATFESARVGLAIVDLRGRFVRANRAYAGLAGLPPEDLVGEQFTNDPDQLKVMINGRGPETTHVEREIREGVWVLQGITLRHSPAGEASWFVVDAQDVTLRRQAQDALAHQVLHDQLTGLPNRVLAMDRLHQALAMAQRAGGSAGVLFCDVDGFKQVNDRHGHLLGDIVLQVVGRRLEAALRPTDTVARLGGDEFLVIVAPPVNQQHIEELSTRLEAAASAPLRGRGTDTRVGLSVGAVLTQTGDDTERALARADEAMYEVKRSRRASQGAAT